MSAASSSTSPNGTEQCKVVIDGTLFDLGCLGPALAIILILAFLERRTKFKLDYCDGRPGLLVPFDFLGSLSNRYTIAITFGATASKCLLLFLKQENGIFVLPGPHWLKVFQDLVSVLVYGILFYPFFACLTTNYKFIGSLLGFLYGAIRFSIGLVVNYQCLPEIHEVSKKLGLLWLAKVPTYLCLLFIVMRFAVLFYLAVKKKWLWLPSEREEDHSSSRKLVAKPEIIHVKHLLRQGSELEGAQDEWYLRLRNYFYKPRPDFKFSTQLFSTLLVAAIALFQLFVAILVVTELGREVLNSTNRGVSDQDVTLRGLYRVAIDGVELGVIVAAIVSVLMMLHFMKSHRDHVLQLYRGQSKFAQGVVVSPARLMGRSLCFCGYQIAYIVAGFILLASILSLIGLCLAFVFKFADQLFPVFAQYREAVLQTLLPPFCMAIFVWLFQLFLGYFVFRDRDFPNITITVDNRRLYSILSYFFFFFNVILGIFSVAMRLFKGMLLGIIFVSRIDRTSLMYGFQAWDRAFVAYLGFLHVLVAHRHPVLLTFCQLLIDRNSEKPLGEPLEERPPSTSIQRSYAQEPGVPTAYRRELRHPRLSRRAVNRWLVTATLIRNPSLIPHRRSGCSRPLWDFARSNSDVDLLV